VPRSRPEVTFSYPTGLRITAAHNLDMSNRSAVLRRDDLIKSPLNLASPGARNQSAVAKMAAAIVIPLSLETRAYQSHTYAALWKNYPPELLAGSAH